MLLQPRDIFEKLEFDKIRQLLEKNCLGELGVKAVGSITPDTDLQTIVRNLNEVQEYRLTIDHNDRFPLSSYTDISEELRYLEVPDYVLPEEGLLRLSQILRLTSDIFGFFSTNRQDVYPHLYQIIRSMTFDEGLLEAIDQVIDEEGQIRPDASPELLRIRKSILSKQKELDKVFRSVIQEYRSKGWLTDNVESFRNGRRVLSVPSEHKRKIRGIIHDESTTGKTAFIEPEPIIDINNDIFDLETDERREIYRILKELSATLRPYAGTIHLYQELLVRFDLIQAKARLAVLMNGRLPKVIDQPNLSIREGYHPLLLLKNQKTNKKTVPFDLVLHKQNRIVVLSGPNAGGKSITMKSVGLLQLMLQSGMLIPVDMETEMGIFHSLFTDIGDQQSIDDDLSTYSSRLQNMRNFLQQANRRSLVLIDEFGSGTDPQIGGAIAEAILMELNKKKVHGLITTHYSNLKIFAFKTPGIVNASMTFDKDTLSPTYEFRVGRPGSSYAFEIAAKSGLQKEVLAYAKKRTGKNEKAVDQLLVDLQREKQEIEEKLQNLIEREQKLEHLIRTYDHMHREMEYRRKKLKLETKEQALQQTAKDNKEFERLIRQIREEKNLEKAKEMAARVKEERKALSEQVQDLREEVYYQPTKKQVKQGEIKAGDHVRLRSGGATGTVESVDRGRAVIHVGALRMTVKLRDLVHAGAPLDVQSTRSVKTEMLKQSANFQSRIDIRGMRYEEALQVVEEFMDQALVSSANHLKIVHGKGNGILRKAVRSKLREYNVEMDIRHPEPEQGGEGVTLIEIKD